MGGPYQARTIFESLDLAWSILRAFPKELLKKIPKKTLDVYYARRREAKEEMNAATDQHKSKSFYLNNSGILSLVFGLFEMTSIIKFRFLNFIKPSNFLLI